MGQQDAFMQDTDPFGGGEFGDFDGGMSPSEPNELPVEMPAAATPALPTMNEMIERKAEPTPGVVSEVVSDGPGEPVTLTTQADSGQVFIDEPSAAPSAEAAVTAPEPEAEAEPEAEPSGTAEPEPEGEAPEPELKGKKRRYVILQVTDVGKFKQLSWLVDKDGNIVPKNTKGALRQSIALCHGAEDALKVGHAALGSPMESVRLVAVAALHFQVKTIAPAPVEPTRVKLSIS